MSESILREKAKEFAKNIVFITREIKSNNNSYKLIPKVIIPVLSSILSCLL